MRRRTKVDKCIDMLEEILNDHHFHPALFANIITNTFPPYTQARLIELIRYIEKYNLQEAELERRTQTGQYSNDNPQIKRPDTSWIHESYHGESAHFNVQRTSAF